MDKLKQWVALTVAACLAIAAAGWFLLVAPKRSEAAELREQAAAQTDTNAKLRNELQVLKAQAKELPKEQAKLAAVSAKIPDNPALPGLVRSLLEAAGATGVELVSITPGEPVLVVAAQPAAGQPGAKPAAPAQPGSAQQAPVAPASPASPASPGKPGAAPAAPGPAGQLASIPVAVNVVGDYFEVQQFVAAAEELTRAVRVEKLQITPGASPAATKGSTEAAVEEGRMLSATLNGFVYMAANRPAPVAAAVPGTEAAPADAAAAGAAPAESADAAE